MQLALRKLKDPHQNNEICAQSVPISGPNPPASVPFRAPPCLLWSLDVVRQLSPGLPTPSFHSPVPRPPELLPVLEPGPAAYRRRPGLDLRLDHRPVILRVRVPQKGGVKPGRRQL